MDENRYAGDISFRGDIYLQLQIFDGYSFSPGTVYKGTAESGARYVLVYDACRDNDGSNAGKRRAYAIENEVLVRALDRA